MADLIEVSFFYNDFRDLMVDIQGEYFTATIPATPDNLEQVFDDVPF